MNWLIPWAPAELTEFGSYPLSASIWAAMIDGGAAGQIEPACWTMAAYCAGTAPGRRP